MLILVGSPVAWGAADPSETNRELILRLEKLEQEVRELRRIASKPNEQVVDSARVAELEQNVRILERRNELAEEKSKEVAKSAPVLTAGPGGFQLRSSDTNFVLKLRGYIQADARFYPSDHAGGTANDTFLMRRVRPILEGTVYEKYDFRLMMDFASSINSVSGNNAFAQDAYLTARFLPEFQLQAGKFKEPVGLERLQSGANLLFVERGFPTQLVPNRDVGIQVQGDLWDGRFNYQAGVFNGVGDGGSGDIEFADDDKDFAARLFATPFKNSPSELLRGLGIGVAGTIGNQEGALRTYSTPGQQRFFAYRTGTGLNAANANVVADGQHWRLAPQAYYYWGPFGLLGEYVISEQKVRRDDGAVQFQTFHNTGWQVAGSYFLTGEDNSFKAINPRKPFSPGERAWGAWELAARVGSLQLDDDAFPLFANPASSASSAFSWGVGVNWHLNRNVKFSLNYEHTTFGLSKLPLAAGTVHAPLLEQSENVVLFRAQLAF